jgi:phage/plasmid-like protein (TIGR03299 family)
MSHELEIIDGRALVLGRDPMWHSLGQVTGRNFGIERINEFAPEILSPVTLQPTYVAVNGDFGLEYKETPLKGAIVRTIDGKVVGEGVGKDTYGIVQSKDAFEWGSAISEFGDLPLVSAGTLREGRQFFFTYQMGDESPAGIQRTPYCTVCSSHDGSMKLLALFSDIITVCANTMAWNIADADDRVQLRHTARVEDRMRAALITLERAAERVQAVNKQIETLAMIKVQHFKPLMDTLLPRIDVKEGESTRGQTLRDNARTAVRELLRSQVIEDDHRQTGWAWVQAVNTYEQWNQPIRGGDRATRQFDAVVKGKQPLTAMAVEQVLALV